MKMTDLKGGLLLLVHLGITADTHTHMAGPLHIPTHICIEQSQAQQSNAGIIISLKQDKMCVLRN